MIDYPLYYYSLHASKQTATLTDREADRFIAVLHSTLNEENLLLALQAYATLSLLC